MEEASQKFEPSANFYSPPLYSDNNWLLLLGIESDVSEKKILALELLLRSSTEWF